MDHWPEQVAEQYARPTEYPVTHAEVQLNNPNKNAMHEILEKYNYTVDEIKRKINLFGVNPEVKK